MTREEAMTFLNIIADKLGFPDNEGYTLEDRKRMREAIKVLAQEPFMNKPCVAHRACHKDKVKMLDKMKAEISCLPDLTFNRTKVLRIIDGYRIKSEVEK